MKEYFSVLDITAWVMVKGHIIFGAIPQEPPGLFSRSNAIQERNSIEFISVSTDHLHYIINTPLPQKRKFTNASRGFNI